MFTIVINPLIAIISLSTAASVLVHDTHIDKVATAAIATPVTDNSNKSTNISPDLHTHAERHSLSRLLGSQTPGLQPRLGEDKKHLLQKHVRRGHHPFDNYNLPII